MLKVFIPEKIFKKFSINSFEKLNLENLEKNFKNLKITDFQAKFIEGKYFELDEDLDFLVFCNGFFWKKFFLWNGFYSQTNIYFLKIFL